VVVEIGVEPYSTPEPRPGADHATPLEDSFHVEPDCDQEVVMSGYTLKVINVALCALSQSSIYNPREAE
jgi:hypothetical protein